MTGPQNAPLEMQFGPLVSGMLADLHSAHGVTLKLGTGVDRITGSGGRVTGVRLVSGEVLPADLVVVSVGGIPETDWLDGSGLEIANGIVCDSRCRALGGRSGPAGRGSTSDIYAAGDVARWHHEHLGAAVRLENRTNATDSAWAVAAAITGETGPYAPVPYMWTDQHSVKIQVHGMLSADAEVTIADGDPETADENGKRRFVARFTAGGRVTGVLGWNMPKQTRLRRQEILDSLPN
jgi:NADPH-dependent 2,4-dienoyl-CoA reductase/sulfur reductase-like enzyme